MDPFQIRMECLGLVKRLTASQQSIAKVVDFAQKHAAVASDDIWECIVSECSKTSLNARLNILFLVDALLLSIVDPVGFSSSSANTGQASTSAHTTSVSMKYLKMITRDIDQLIDAVVPGQNWDAVRLNASSTLKVISSWKLLGIIDTNALSRWEDELQSRKSELSYLPSAPRTKFSKNDVLRRIEEDRERHKRLRERAWILPAKTFAESLPSKVVKGNITQAKSTEPPAIDSFDVEFDAAWETTSDLNEDDIEGIRQDDTLWWGGEQFETHQRTLARQLEEALTELHVQNSQRHDAERQRKRSPSPHMEQQHTKSTNRWRRIGSSEGNPPTKLPRNDTHMNSPRHRNGRR